MVLILPTGVLYGTSIDVENEVRTSKQNYQTARAEGITVDVTVAATWYFCI